MRLTHELQRRSLYIFLLLILIGFLGASGFTFPAYDDYHYADLVQRHGLKEFQYYHYFNWGGRLASNLMVSVLATIDPFWNYYGTWSISIILLTYGSFAYLCYQLAKIVHVSALASFLILTTAYLTTLPTIIQFLYWITGALSYTVGVALTCVGLGLLIQRELRPSRLIDVVLSLMTIIIVTNNEITLLGWCEVLLTFLFLKYCKTKKVDRGIALVLLVGIVAGLVAIVAPGNFVRQQLFEKSGQVFRTLGNGILHYFIFSLRLLSVPLLVVLLRWHREVYSWVDQLFSGIDTRMAKWIVWLHWFLFLFTTTATAFWGMGRKPNTRSLNVIMFYYWLMIPFVWWWIVKVWKWRLPRWNPQLERKAQRYWIIALVLSLIATKNVWFLGGDYLFRFQDYKVEALDKRAQLLKGAGKDVTLTPYQVRARTTFYHDFKSHDVAPLQRLFGLRSLTIRE